VGGGGGGGGWECEECGGCGLWITMDGWELWPVGIRLALVGCLRFC
jgi:hypothetical protein